MMHEDLHKEFKRVFEALIATDPGDPRYKNILNSFELLDSIGPSINDFLFLVPQTYAEPQQMCNGDCADCSNCEEAPASETEAETDNVTEFPMPAPEAHPTEPEPAKPTLSAAEVRSKLATARRAGVNVAAIIKEFGADNFTALPSTKYGELLERIEHESGGMD